MTMEQAIAMILPPDAAAMRQAADRWDSLAKLPHSLGELETAVIRLAGIQRTPMPHLHKKLAVVMCADNGVLAEKTSPSSMTVTAAQAMNFARGGGVINAFARTVGVDVHVVDVGIATPYDPTGIDVCSIRKGTANLAVEPAMTAAQCRAAVECGIVQAQKAAQQGVDLLITGEMGIGNTTTASAVTAVLLGLPPEQIVARGAGNAESTARKAVVIRRALALHRPDPQSPLDVLTKVGGLDIAAMCGLYLGGAAFGLPVVIDGLISGAAALCAARLAPSALDYMLPSHCSAETAGKQLLDALHFRPLITAGLCLGEGTGGVLGAGLLDAALAAYTETAALADI